MNDSLPAVSSFVVRCKPLAGEFAADTLWRIRVTHVQGQEEVTVVSLDEAMRYIERIMKRGMQK